MTNYIQRLGLTVLKEDNPYKSEKIQASAHTADLIKRIHSVIGNDVQEFFYVLFLNRSQKLVAYSLLSMGGITGTVADIRLIMTTALLSGALNLVIAHNHPSGSLIPSKADLDITAKVKNACTLLELNLLDHVIISDEGYYSFADEGTLNR